MNRTDRVPTSDKLLLEICELLVGTLVLQATSDSAAAHALVYRLRSAVCFYYAYYGSLALCRFANHLKSADAVMVDFTWLDQTPEIAEPEDAILYYRNASETGGV